jgi:hypothetical protein
MTYEIKFVDVFEKQVTLIGFPLSLAPFPLMAVYSLPMMGANTMPITIRLLTTSPTEMLGSI